jgi:hypothetical protein
MVLKIEQNFGFVMCIKGKTYVLLFVKTGHFQHDCSPCFTPKPITVTCVLITIGINLGQNVPIQIIQKI